MIFLIYFSSFLDDARPFLDNWNPAVSTHHLNHPNCSTVKKNILEIDSNKIDEIVPDSDIIIGSPPCVSFSMSNKAGKADKSLGIKLIYAYLRIVLWKQNSNYYTNNDL